MGPGGVEVLPPLGDGAADVVEAKEQALIQQLVAHPAIEALDIPVLHRLARRDVVPFDAMILRPGEDGVRGELRAGSETITPGLPRREMRAVSSRATRRPEIDVSGDRGQAFARHVIDDVQHTKASAAGELAVHEVQRPARVCPCLDQDRRPRADRAPPRPPLAHRQALLAVEPVDAVDPRRSPSRRSRMNRRRYQKRRRSLARSRSLPRSAVSGGRHYR